VGKAATALAVVAGVVALPTAAWARFSDRATASISVGSASVAAQSVTTSKKCSFLGIIGDSVTVSWADGDPRTSYTVRLNANFGSDISRTTSGSSVTVSVSPGVTYAVTVASALGSWTATTTADTVGCGWLG